MTLVFKLPEKPHPEHSDLPVDFVLAASRAARAVYEALTSTSTTGPITELAGHGSWASSGVSPEQRAHMEFRHTCEGWWAAERSAWAAQSRAYAPRDVRVWVASLEMGLAEVEPRARAAVHLRSLLRKARAELEGREQP